MILSFVERMFEYYRRDPTRDEIYPQAASSKPTNRLSLMAWIEIADIGERDELLELFWRAPRDGLEQEADVVADVVATQHRAREPPGRVVKNR